VIAEPLIPISYANAPLEALEALECAGHNRLQVFRDAGLTLPDAAVHDPELELPARDFTRLYGYAFRRLEAATSLRPEQSLMEKEVVDLLCYCLITCSDLQQVIERASAYLRAIGPLGAGLTASNCGITVRLDINFRRREHDGAAMLVAVAGMSMLYQLFCWLIGQRIRLIEFSLRYPTPERKPLLADFLDVPIQYGQAQDSLCFPSRYLAQPVVRSCQDLQGVIDYFPFDLHFCGKTDGTLAGRLRAFLSSTLQRNQPLPTLNTCAQLFHMSTTTLRRRLRDEGVGYANLRGMCQQQHAQYLLSCSDQPIEEIARLTGFGDDRAFRRAFRARSGLSPSQFRSRSLGN